jgi:phage tail-like protein
VSYPTRHILLRDRRDWLGTRSGLEVDRNGVLTLARVPGPAEGKMITVAATYPYPREVSGLALGPCDAVFVSDTAGDRVLFVDGLCKAEAWIGGLKAPRGLAFTALALLVAVTAQGRVQHFALPALEANLAWSAWPQPSSLAVDSKGRVLAIDAGLKSLHRVEANGDADTAFDAAIAGAGKLVTPLFVAVGREDRAVVSDTGANQVFVFDAQGVFLLALAGPAGWQPGALATIGSTIFAADAATGAILVFDEDGTLQGAIPGYLGPVTAMAASASGHLYVKTGLDAAYIVLKADTAFVSQGALEAGPFDAGESCEWEWARVDATVPDDTGCLIEVAQRPAALPAPVAADWKTLPSSDALLGPLLPNAAKDDRRYLWLRVTLSTGSAQASPSVAQVRAATPGENYLEHLPFIYAKNDQRKDGREGFLSRLLKLVRSEWRGVEELIDEMARIADPQFLDATDLPWLAQWLALELPQIASDDERRDLIAHAVTLLARRGTPASIADFVELHTGIRPAIVEAFGNRHVWVLGQGSRLDFETVLPPLDPNSMVVPDQATEEPCCPGPIGRAIVGESGPLAAYQLGLPLFSEDAYRFCVFVDAYRVRANGTLQEIRRIVDREKPAYTDYRIELFEPNLRVGFQSRVGIDAIVGGDPPPWTIAATLGIDTRLSPRDAAARVGDATLGDGTLSLT